jgi:hypothetical protein
LSIGIPISVFKILVNDHASLPKAIRVCDRIIVPSPIALPADFDNSEHIEHLLFPNALMSCGNQLVFCLRKTQLCKMLHVKQQYMERIATIVGWKPCGIEGSSADAGLGLSE